MKRKVRVGERVCRCGAYKFPHREMGGNCDGGAFVYRHFEQQIWGDCRDCHFREHREEDCVIECQVLEGRDEVIECPALQEHIRYHEIKLYGVNKCTRK